MFRTFNMGIGFVVVAHPGEADRLIKGFDVYGHSASVIGEIVEGTKGVEIH
jgi:phosphoribosylaminoimidazole (AIR) synthetase